VRREACREDRRGAFAALTGSGEARMREALDIHRGQLAELLDGSRSRRGARLDSRPS